MKFICKMGRSLKLIRYRFEVKISYLDQWMPPYLHIEWHQIVDKAAFRISLDAAFHIVLMIMIP